MLGPYDFALIGGLFVLCLFGLRGGVTITALLAAGLAGCVALALSIGTAGGLLALVALWFVIAFSLLVLWRRLRGAPVTRRSRLAALLVSTGEFAVIAVLGTGALLTQLPQEGSIVRSAAAYPLIAEAGARLMAPDLNDPRQQPAMLTYPEPLPKAGPESPEPSIPAARPVDWAEVELFDNRINRVLTGHTIAADRAPISFEVGGTVRSVHVALGDRFTKGTVLAELDPTPLQIALDERRAGLIEAEATAHEANLTLQRQRQLRASGTVSQAALDRAEAAAESAQSRLAVAMAGIRQAEDDLADVVLRAPFDGIVDKRLIEPAQTVPAGAPAFEIQDPNGGYQIEMVVPETLIRQIQAGSEHRAILFDGNDSPVVATVHEIGSRANATTGFPVTLDIVGQSGPIHAGMTAEVFLSLTRKPGADGQVGLAAVPYTAVLPAADETYVSFVYDEVRGVLEQREIAVAGREGTTALVSDGLRPGEIVAVRGLPFLIDGQPVTLRGVGIARYDN